MKMVRAIVRPEKVEEVVDSLEKEGFIALTKIDVFGRGKQKGIFRLPISASFQPYWRIPEAFR